jgi:hypothetical protein
VTGDFALCDCPAAGAVIRHQRQTCTDPIVIRLGCFADDDQPHLSLLLPDDPEEFPEVGLDSDPIYGPVQLGPAILAKLTTNEIRVLQAKLGSARAQMHRVWPRLIGFSRYYHEISPENFDLADDLSKLHELHFSGRRLGAE